MSGVCRFLHSEAGNRRLFIEHHKGREQLYACQFSVAIFMRFRKNRILKQLLHICRCQQMLLCGISILFTQTACTGTNQFATSALADRGDNPCGFIFYWLVPQFVKNLFRLLEILHVDFRRCFCHLLPIAKPRLECRRAHGEPLFFREIRLHAVRRFHPQSRPRILLADGFFLCSEYVASFFLIELRNNVDRLFIKDDIAAFTLLTINNPLNAMLTEESRRFLLPFNQITDCTIDIHAVRFGQSFLDLRDHFCFS